MSRSLRAVGSIGALLLLLVMLAGCGRVQERVAPDFSGRTIEVVATTGMVGDIVAEVGGDRVHVTTLMGPGVDPHLYKASEGDVERLDRADIVFYSGLHLEAKLADVFEKMGDRIVTVPVTDLIPRARLHLTGSGASTYDPHVWFDVSMWSEATESVRRTLVEADPAHAADYDARAMAYQKKLTALDAYVRSVAESIPADKRVLITAHDAFGYFAAAYGFEVRGLQGISTASEAGAGDVQELAAFIVERQIPAVFVESSISPRMVRALQEAVRARGYDVQIGGLLFSDAMGDPGTPEGTYIGMVRHNIDTIAQALKSDGAATP
ncbi:MAG: zinc ABC transporter substrate-binding protein [Thermomicrobiales bacterium]|nr:zinc ABC transporter substrate-binding protein [Thermomicrobiales bacterium]